MAFKLKKKNCSRQIHSVWLGIPFSILDKGLVWVLRVYPDQRTAQGPPQVHTIPLSEHAEKKG